MQHHYAHSKQTSAAKEISSIQRSEDGEQLFNQSGNQSFELFQSENASKKNKNNALDRGRNESYFPSQMVSQRHSERF